MSRTTVVLLGIFITLGLLGVSVFAAGVGMRNNFVAQEEGLKAQYKQNQNNYDNYWKKLKEAAQVPEMYTSQLKDVYTAALNGRYGSNGSKAVFQWIQEQNPQVDASVFKQLQQIIEAGRNSFEADQKTLLDKKRVYETNLRHFPSNLIAGALGFPTIDLAAIDIVTSAETDEAFRTKKSAPINLKGE